MAYITNYNFYCIEQSYSYHNINWLKGVIYKREINLFTSTEINYLLFYQMLLRLTPDLNRIPYVRRLPERASYHHYENCEMLNSDFVMKKEEIIDGKKEEYIDNVKSNSGRRKIIFNPIEAESTIDKLLIKLAEFLETNHEIRNHIIIGPKTLKKDRVNHSSTKLLEEYTQTIKIPIIDNLKLYYQGLYNPNLNFEEKILQSMGLKLCNECYNKKLFENFKWDDVFKI